MFLRFLDFVKAHIWAISYAFMAAITLNVFFHIYTHQTTALTPWKGGGFGMYTEPHSDSRAVWVLLSGVDEAGAEKTAEVRLYPKSREFRAWQSSVSVAGSKVLERLYVSAEGMRFYPRASNAQNLLDRADRILWPTAVTGGVIPKDERSFAPEDIEIIVLENRFEIESGVINRNEIFRFGGAE